LLNEHYVGRIRVVLSKRGDDVTFVEEVLQALRRRLLVAEPSAAPRIATYRGTAPLVTWMRAAALRVAVDLRRGRKHHQTLDPELPLAGPDPEARYLKLRYASEVKSGAGRGTRHPGETAEST
jgi:RNA polymerase sigma-70 factor (ECF subfamily)